MPSNYPAGYDTFTTHHANESITSNDINHIQDAALATQQALGLNPSWTYAQRAGGTTSAVTKLPYWNVLDYGAKADGVTDDTLAIHAARDAADVNGRLYFPRGTYLVSSASVAALTASIAGQVWQLHPQATLKIPASVPTNTGGLTVNAANVVIEGGVFDGSLITQLVPVVKVITGSTGVRLVNLTVTGNPMFYGIAVYNTSSVRITDCKVSNTYDVGIWVQNSLAGPSNISNITITDCVVDNSAMPTSSITSGMTVYGNSSTQRCSRVRFSRNTVLLSRGNTSGVSGGIGLIQCDGYAVVDNFIDGSNIAITCPGSTQGRIIGNLATGFNQLGIEVPANVTDTVISANSVDPAGQPATAGIQTSAGTNTNMTISGNTLKGFTASGTNVINFGSGSITVKASITGNIIVGNVTSGAVCGVTFNGPITGVTMTGNLVDLTSTSGALGVQFLRAVTGATITGNEFANIPAAAVQLASSNSADTIDYVAIGTNTYRSTPIKLKNVLSGGATLGTNVAIATTMDIQVFTAAGTWTKPSGALKVTAIVMGGGGGGGCGRRGAAGSVRTGGGGGGGGGRTFRQMPASACGATESVTVAAGGTGAAAQTADDTNGTAGTSGGTSTFGSHARATGGTGGSGGSTSSASGGSAGSGQTPGGGGGASSGTGGAGATAGNPNDGGGGGGAGGGLDASNNQSAGGTGIGSTGTAFANATAGTAGGGNGANGTDAPANSAETGTSGAGGGSNASGAGGAGGNGGRYGNGGGGGGASVNGSNSGKGGDGAAGIVIVISEF